MAGLPAEIDNPEAPLFPIGVVAELLKVTDQTLRVYEKCGVIKPSRRNKDRYYSANDIVWLKCIRRFIKQDGLNLKGIEKLIQFVPCYEISPCKDCADCTAHITRSQPFQRSPAQPLPPGNPANGGATCASNDRQKPEALAREATELDGSVNFLATKQS